MKSKAGIMQNQPMINDKTTQLDILYTNIGRGHPFYLDGILQAMHNRDMLELVRGNDDVFNLSRGMALNGWKLIRWLYRTAPSSGMIGRAYRLIRSKSDYERDTALFRLLGRDLIRNREGVRNPLLVAHPLLVGILRRDRIILYQHGELVTPAEAIVRGADTVFVPTSEVARDFNRAGYNNTAIVITGLCIEPKLALRAGELYERRLKRITGKGPLTACLFSSGAEPPDHIRQLAAAASSIIRSGGRVIAFANSGGSLSAALSIIWRESSTTTGNFSAADSFPDDFPQAAVIEYQNRQEEDSLTTQLFDRFDYYIGPSHERTNWGVGLGLPMFITTPLIGPFAPLNLQLAVNHGVAKAIAHDSAKAFGHILLELRNSGQLLRMCESGFGRYSIEGFSRCANYLIDRFGSSVKPKIT